MAAKTPLEIAADEFDNPTAFARAIGRRQSSVWDWLRRGWPAPDACEDIERAVKGKVKAVDLLKPAVKAKKRKGRTAQQAAA